MANAPGAPTISSRWLRWPEAGLCLFTARVIVFLMSPKALANLLRSHDVRPAEERPNDLPEAFAVGATVRRLGRRLRPPRCLANAVCVHLMLKRRHIAHTIHLGMRKAEGKLEAHAWVSVCDKPVIGKTDFSLFDPIAQFGGRTS